MFRTIRVQLNIQRVYFHSPRGNFFLRFTSLGTSGYKYLFLMLAPSPPLSVYKSSWLWNISMNYNILCTQCVPIKVIRIYIACVCVHTSHIMESIPYCKEIKETRHGPPTECVWLIFRWCCSVYIRSAVFIIPFFFLR